MDRLQRVLEAAGVKVWRDTADLWPGEDWRGRIRQAITQQSLAFIACFSEHSEARSISGQNEELNLAIDQLRLRRPDQPWLIPVRFADVSVPDIEVGGGRTLNSIQRADLFDGAWDEGAARLVAAVVRILGRSDDPRLPAAPVSVEAQLKAALRDPAGDIAFNDLLLSLASEAREAEAFPDSAPALSGGAFGAATFMIDLVDARLLSMNRALDALVVSAQWVRTEQTPALTRFAERLAPRDAGGSGMVVLLDLRWLPLLVVTYTGALAAVTQGNYDALRCLTVDAQVRDPSDGRLPFIARSHPWRPFSNFDLLPQLLAFRASGEEPSPELVDALQSGRRGKRYTPVSDYLHDTLRDKFRSATPDDEEYSDLFDRMEALLALIAIDARANLAAENRYFDPPFFGRSTWRERHMRDDRGLAFSLNAEFEGQRSAWGPLRAGLFGGDLDRAAAALSEFALGWAEARSHRW